MEEIERVKTKMQKEINYKEATICVTVLPSKPDGFVPTIIYRSGPNRPINPTRKIPPTDPETVRYPTEEEAFEAAFAFGKAAIESF